MVINSSSNPVILHMTTAASGKSYIKSLKIPIRYEITHLLAKEESEAIIWREKEPSLELLSRN